MDQPQEELLQIALWLSEEGLCLQSPKEDQLCALWRSLQWTRGRLSSVTGDLETQRSKNSAEMAEVHKSLKEIRIFTGHQDVLTQEIQDENYQLKEQLQRLISLQDAQISEVAKMLYQQGLTELIHSSPSEQVAYLLVERASLLETNEVSIDLKSDGNTAEQRGKKAQVLSSSSHQADACCLAGQADSVQRKCSRLERDLEEGSRRLAMAHNEIRHLTEELESANLTVISLQRDVERLQSAQQQQQQADHKILTVKAEPCQATEFAKALASEFIQREVRIQSENLPGFQEALKTLFITRDECESLKKEICESLKRLDRERSKNHEIKEKCRTKLLQNKQKFDDETTWRDERINNLVRELSLSSHSLAKEKELTLSITVENDKLLVERRRLLQQLNEEEHTRKESNLTAALSKCRLDFLEMENKTLRNKIINISSQLAVMERSLQNVQSHLLTAELKKVSDPMQVLPLPISSLKMPHQIEFQGLFANTQSKQLDPTSSSSCSLLGNQITSSEMGFLNPTSTKSLSHHSVATAIQNSSDSICS